MPHHKVCPIMRGKSRNREKYDVQNLYAESPVTERAAEVTSE